MLTREEKIERLARHSSRAESGCLLWTGSLRGGYGLVRFEGVTWSAHRVSYEVHVGPIPDGTELDHLCRVHNCIEPSHLEAVSHRENTLRGVSPSALHASKTHCHAGHALTPDNLSSYCRRNGERICLACLAKRSRDTRARAALRGQAC